MPSRYARAALKCMDEIAAHSEKRSRERRPFDELMYRWRAFLLRLPRNIKPRKLYMSGEELAIIAAECMGTAGPNWSLYDVYLNITTGSTNADGSLFYISGIPVYQRKK